MFTLKLHCGCIGTGKVGWIGPCDVVQHPVFLNIFSFAGFPNDLSQGLKSQAEIPPVKRSADLQTEVLPVLNGLLPLKDGAHILVFRIGDDL